jgi:pimeloyl-ACP methyl ester carboxylesterase
VLSDTAPRIGTTAGWNDRIERLRSQGMESLGPAILERWFAPDFADAHPAVYRIYLNMLTRTPVDGYAGICAALRDADLDDEVRRIEAQTLVLCGALDLATPPDRCRELADALPRARFELIEAAAHLPSVERPHELVARLIPFLLDNGAML